MTSGSVTQTVRVGSNAGDNRWILAFGCRINEGVEAFRQNGYGIVPKVEPVDSHKLVAVGLEHHLSLDVLGTVVRVVVAGVDFPVLDEVLLEAVVFENDVDRLLVTAVSEQEIAAVRWMVVRRVELAQIVADWELGN